MAKTPKKKPTSSYWKRRFELLQDEALRPADEYLLDLGEIYERAAQELERKMLYWTKRFADNNDLTMAEAKKILEAGELREFHWTLEEYAKKAAHGSRWAREVENASARVHLSRLEAMRLDLKGVVEGAVPEDMRWLFEEVYERAYYGAGHEVARGFGTSFPMQKIDEKALDRVMRKPWTTDARTFSDRLWTNKAKLIGTLETKLAQGLMLGTSHDKLIRDLRDEMRTSFANAQRIVRTESAFFSAAGDRDAYQSLGVEKFQILATLDTRTSEICQEMDQQIFEMKDFEIGVTAPPFHPNCRSTTVPYFADMEEIGERAARDITGKSVTVRGDMGYQEWYNEYIENANMYLHKTVECRDGLSGVKVVVPRGSKFDNPITIAKDEEIRKLNYLVRNYGAGTWEKKVSSVTTARFRYDVHWFEKNGMDQYEIKCKNRKEIKK